MRLNRPLGVLGPVTRALVAASTAVLPVSAAAQQHAPAVQTQLGITAGRATDALGARSGAVTVAPTVMLRFGDGVAADLGLQGTRFGETSWAGTANAGAGIRLPLSPWVALTASSAAAWTTTSYDARFTSVGAIPALEAVLGPVTLFGGAQFARGSSSIDHEASTPQFPIGSRPTVQTVETARTLRGAVYGAGMRHVTPGAVAYTGYREERSRVGDITVVDRAVAANAERGRAAFAASIGVRRDPDGRSMFGGGRLAVEIRPGASLQVDAARYPASYLTGALAGTSMSIGVLVHPGRPTRAAPHASGTQRVRGVPAPAPGTHRLAIHAPRAARVELAGDWTNWKPVPAARAPDGTWYADVRLAPGRYRYAFRLDGGSWRVPEGVAATEDGFGGRSALLTVK